MSHPLTSSGQLASLPFIGWQRWLCPVLLVLLALSARPAAVAQATDTVRLTSDRLSQGRRVYLANGWRYHAGDNQAWAEPSFDDSRWNTLNPTLPRRDLPPSLSTGISWLRLHLTDRSQLRPLLLHYRYLGATELYLNGRLLRREGELNSVPSRVWPAESGKELLELPLDVSTDLVVAVRFAPWQFWFLPIGNSPCFEMEMLTEQTLRREQARRASVTQACYFLAGFLLLLTLLHVVLFQYNPAQQANRYFARYALAMTLSIVWVAYLLSVGNFIIGPISLLLPYLVFILFITGNIWVVRALYTLFSFRPGWLYSSLWVVGIGVILYNLYDGGLSALFPLFMLAAGIEQLRLTVRALRQQQRGAGIIAAGFAIGLLCLLLVALAITILVYSHHALPKSLDYPLLFSFFLILLMPPLSISLYLAREFALDARLLQVKLSEVERLSAQTLAQEQEKQALLTAQNETLEQQVAQRTAELQHSLAELRATQDQLIRQEKLASVGQLAKGIVDRILNPLNYVANFSQVSDELVGEVVELLAQQRQVLPTDILDELLDTLGAVQDNSGKIQEHSSATTRILKDMQKLLKEKSRDFVETDLNGFLETKANDALQALRAEYPALALQLVFDPAPQPVLIRLLPFEFGQLVQGLVSNACYTLAEKSKLAKDFTPELRLSTRLAGEQAVVRLRDNGKGIAAREVPKLFSPFFTTKPTAKGTGLGLYMAKDTVEVHQGSITIDTLEGEFTEVTLTLPAAHG